MNCGRENLIPGIPWLKEINPTINWKLRTIDINENTNITGNLNEANQSAQISSMRQVTQELPTYQDLLPSKFVKETLLLVDENFFNYLWEVKPVYIQGTNWILKVDGKLVPFSISKTSIAAELVQSSTVNQVTLPKGYEEFSSIFLEEATHHNPPSWPYNHPINLDETFIPKVGKVYSLTPEEQKATKDFLEENLKSGKIRPSNSPQALCYVSTVKSKCGTLSNKFLVWVHGL